MTKEKHLERSNDLAEAFEAFHQATCPDAKIAVLVVWERGAPHVLGGGTELDANAMAVAATAVQASALTMMQEEFKALRPQRSFRVQD
jgi:hypothetical protein